MKKIRCLLALATVSIFATGVFAQDELHEAIDAGDLATAQSLVKKGKYEDIYCGKLTPNQAVEVYEKVFKKNPEESFANCPTQFSYGYGTQVCANKKAFDACNEVVSLLLLDAETGNTKAIDALESACVVSKNRVL